MASRAASRWRARSITARTSARPAWTALSSSNAGPGSLGDEPGERRLAAAGRAVEDHRVRAPLLDRPAQRRACRQQPLLTDELVERARAHPRRRAGRQPGRMRAALRRASSPNRCSMPTVWTRQPAPIDRAAPASCSSPLVAIPSPPSAVRTPAEVGERPARLLDDHLQRGEIPQRDGRIAGDLGRPLGNEHVLPEVAEAARAPAPPAELEQRRRIGLAPVLDARRCTAARRPARAPPRPSAAGLGCPVLGHERARPPRAPTIGDRARARTTTPTASSPVDLERQQRRPHRASRACSSWCRRSGRRSTAGGA